jgi:hypothetical protein
MVFLGSVEKSDGKLIVTLLEVMRHFLLTDF